jgi:orotate phosphoribosyltransferase
MEEELWRIGAVRVDFAQPFTLASGRSSPLYIDCRSLLSYPEVRARAVEGLVRLARPLKADGVAGCETAGIAWAALLASELGLPAAYVRRAPKGHGRRQRIEGSVGRGQRWLLVDDLVTDGGSKLEFFEPLVEAGARVEHCLVLFDRQAGGRAFLKSHGIGLHAVATLRRALEVGEREGRLTREQAGLLLREAKE